MVTNETYAELAWGYACVILAFLSPRAGACECVNNGAWTGLNRRDGCQCRPTFCFFGSDECVDAD